jgi:phage baseplate assembly protein W
MSTTYGYSPRILPFTTDTQTGFSQNRTLKQLAVQNFINLVLCAPGERLFEADFGVGLRNYLFEMNNASTRQSIKQAIISQAGTYLPYIKIEEISFLGSEEDRNLLKINIMFQIALTEEIAGMAFVFHLGGGEFQIVQYGDMEPPGARFEPTVSMMTAGAMATTDATTGGVFVDLDSVPRIHTFESDMFDEEGVGSRSVHSTFGSTDS